MFSRHVHSRLALVVSALICLLAPSLAVASPSTVTVRVEGLTETKVPPTLVTTTTTPVVESGGPAADSCPGTSALGALNIATNGNWSGTWYGGEVKNGVFEGLGYSIETIDGESHLFEAGAAADYYWSFWLNDKLEEEHGACGVEMATGDQVLMLVECAGAACPANPTPLEVEAPTTADVGEGVPVTVKQYNTKGEASPAVGASIEGDGVATTTESQGHATLKFIGTGTYTLKVTGAASGPPAVRTEATICVHNGNDGTCGTQTSPNLSSSASSAGGASVNPPAYKGEYALVPRLTSVIDNHVYSRGHAPRLLSGSILAHTTVTSVSLTLRREYRGRCYAYDGVSTRFMRAHCGTGNPFKVSTSGVFSYLLPESLPPGRYVLDIAATDAAGNYTTLARGTSRIVFYVR
jgi:hypothetical protein